MKKSRIMAAFISGALTVCSFSALNVSAKVIEPEVVKTETWTTSYYIDDKTETLYPYIECRADIYNDGSVIVFFWNTHEWDGFEIVSHKVTIANSVPVKDNSMEYTFSKGEEYFDGDEAIYCVSADNYKTGEPFVKDYSFWDEQDVSYYPSDYSYMMAGNNFSGNTSKQYYIYRTKDNRLDPWKPHSYTLNYYAYNGPLSKMPVNDKLYIKFTPKVDATGSYDFYIFGHQFTVSYDMLSEKVIAVPQLTDEEKKIKELEEENAKLKEDIKKLSGDSPDDSILRCDTNDDGVIDGRDATTILTIYALNSTGKDIKTFSDYKKFAGAENK